MPLSTAIDLEPVLTSQLGLEDAAVNNLSVLASWTSEQLNKAYEEARMRSLLKPSPVEFTTHLDQNGLLTIKFSSLVNFPSYLLAEGNKSQSMTRSGGRRLYVYLDVFWRSNEYEPNLTLWTLKSPSAGGLAAAY